ncbi:hypothetical protein JOD43_001708 [Pullulanibacillus pueri]|uniref:Uncharacterized protein n=1 Tax=Pullulanibacillus pueri TaxID=1437324 RepID=A0A8J2ZUN9_9BACL|nr:hypothetical protein [Pullulanibacillus pueri]MBM7681541.1 hypothetical protein [Pullulanibacillus pueri]GGH79746.1 hypothetical protein GCM10007096_15130 [Pullulanibacillus pueri]
MKQKQKNLNQQTQANQNTPQSLRSFSFWSWLVLLSLFVAIFIYFLNHYQEAEESLTYFPEDSHSYFKHTETLLSLERKPSGYALKWQISSQTNQSTYLREDLSLLFENGHLIQLYSKWKQNTDTLHHTQSLTIHQASHFETISIHHAEIHHADQKINSKDKMSYAHLYVTKKASDELDSYHIPVEPTEKQWNETFDQSQQQEWHDIITQAEKKYHFDSQDYYSFPLSYLHVFDTNALPGLSIKTTHRAVSQLWEGLYKGYIQGIQLSHQKTVSPLHSSMPLILYRHKADQFLIVIKTADGKIALLKQNI